MRPFLLVNNRRERDHDPVASSADMAARCHAMLLAVLDLLRQGAVLVGPGARVVDSNATATALLAETGGVLRIGPQGSLLPGPTVPAGALRQVIAAASHTEPGRPGCAAAEAATRHAVVLPRAEGRAPVIATTRLLDRPGDGPAVLLLLTDLANEGPIGPSVACLRRLFDLTAAEATVALGVARGKGLPAVAATIGCALSTARTHLSQVFAKTGTRRQAELAWLVARLPCN